MKVQTHHGSTVTLVDIVLVQTGFRPGTVVAVGLINVAFFCSNHEGRRFVAWEIKRGDGYFPGFVVTSVN